MVSLATSTVVVLGATTFNFAHNNRADETI